MLTIILACIQFILISCICVREVTCKSPASFLWATLLLMFGFTHLFDVCASNYQYSEAVMNTASLFVIAFCLFYALVRVYFYKMSRRFRSAFLRIARTEGTNLKTETYYYILLALSVFAITFPLIRYSNGILNTSWAAGRLHSTETSYVNGGQIFYILYYSFAGLMSWNLIRKEKTAAIFVALLLAFVVLITRNRILVTPMLIALIAPILFRMKRITFRRVVFFAVAGFMSLFVIYGLRAFRYYGSLGNALENFNIHNFMAQIWLFVSESNGELGLKNYFYYFISEDNKFLNFGKGHTYLRMLLMFIPTKFSFGLKPPDFAQSMGAAIHMAIGGSIHPTLFGECYANFGFAGCLMGIFWAFFLTFCDFLILRFQRDEEKILVYSLLGSMYIIIARGAVYNAFFNLAYGLIFLSVLSRIIKFAPHFKLRLSIISGRHEKI